MKLALLLKIRCPLEKNEETENERTANTDRRKWGTGRKEKSVLVQF